MADDKEILKNTEENSQNSPNSDDSDTEPPVQHLHLDLGVDFSQVSDAHRLGSQTTGGSGMEPPKREDNPFSFKHFLRSDCGSSYQHKGARPKVYCEGRPISSVSDLEFPQMPEVKQTRIAPEYSSALPDFVQDHLVVEQCYLGNPTNSSFNLDLNLPDFTPSRDSVNINRIKIDSSHSNVNRRCDSNNDLSIPLDLPLRPQTGFPLDLPIAGASQNGARSCPTSDVDVSKSLPDFLADGAVRSQKSEDSAVESPERECERLRRELDLTRRQLAEQTRRAENICAELETTRSMARESLERSNVRAASAENTIKKLRQEVKSLMTELKILRLENQTLRDEEGGASGGHSKQVPNELYSRRLAQELKAAASTAEHSLRQLLTGVDNLRIMAASLENMHRIEERRDSFLDLDEDSGPAL